MPARERDTSGVVKLLAVSAAGLLAVSICSNAWADGPEKRPPVVKRAPSSSFRLPDIFDVRRQERELSARFEPMRFIRARNGTPDHGWEGAVGLSRTTVLAPLRLTTEAQTIVRILGSHGLSVSPFYQGAKI